MHFSNLALFCLFSRSLALKRRQARAQEVTFLQNFGWLDDLFNIIQTIFRPLAAWILGQVALVSLESAGREVTLLQWLVPFLALWFLQRLLVSWLELRRSTEQVAIWRKRVIRPLILLSALLHTVGLLDNVLEAGFRIDDNTITLQAVLTGILILYLFLFLARNLRQVLGDTVLPRAGVEASLTQILATFVGYAIIIFGVITALNVVGLPLTTLTVVAGGLSVGIGFGMQELISNFISGFILLFERSIGPGDVIEVEGTIGIVENVGVRAMRIKNLDNVELIVPNNSFLTNTVTNFTRGDPHIRVHVGVGVSYESDPYQVKAVLIAAAAHASVLAEPPAQVQFVEFGANSLDFELLVWTDNAMAVPNLQSDLRYHIWQALNDAGIDIPFPQRDIHIRTLAPAVNAALHNEIKQGDNTLGNQAL